MLKLSKELQEELSNAKGDAEIRKILTDNGVDPKVFERSLTDEELEKANGGFKNMDGCEVKCPWCGEEESKNISFQFWATLNTHFGTKYRCRTCDNYFILAGNSCMRTDGKWDC